MLQSQVYTQQTRRYLYNIATITIQIYVVYGHETYNYAIVNRPREFAQRANVRDFVAPFTTSCEA